jgi:signal transduction histidine kinase
VGSLDLLQRTVAGREREARLIGAALQSAERARLLVQRLLAFARRQPLQPRPVDVETLVSGVAGLIASSVGPQITVALDLAQGLPRAHADPNQIEMALLNLSVNARDAMPDGGELRISVAAETVGPRHPSGLLPGQYVRLCVADTGGGMDEATLARAVEPFFSTKGIGKGTGLGLSMVDGLARQLGGTLTIQTGSAALANGEAREAQLPPGDYVSIAISDTGTGMSEEVMAQAFDPFFTTKGIGQGTGLGLSQVFGFVHQSGGQVRITSSLGHGTTVRIYLPRYVGNATPAVTGRAANGAVKRGEGEVVLVVEDEERVRAYSVDALEELGYAVLQAPSGPEALTILEGRPDISLLFTDIGMPEMTGRRLADLAGKLRPDLRVLYTTGYSRNVMARDGIIDPGTNFLPKPFSIDQLSVKVREALEG